MKTYTVYLGEYPFTTLIGTVAVQQQEDKEKEATTALYTAIEVFKGHPVVEPE